MTNVKIEVQGMSERMIPSIDNRLTIWGEYLNDERVGVSMGGTGNMISALMSGKGVIVRSTGSDSGMPDAIYDTDKAVRRIEEADPALGQVIREHYENLTSTKEQKMAACGCSERTYYRRLAQSHHAVVMLLGSERRTQSGVRVAVRQLKKAG